MIATEFSLTDIAAEGRTVNGLADISHGLPTTIEKLFNQSHYMSYQPNEQIETIIFADELFSNIRSRFLFLRGFSNIFQVWRLW
jgi:hypothetical protein